MIERLFLVSLALSLSLWSEVRANTDDLPPEKLKLLPRYCGLAVASSGIQGSSTKLFEYPWIAALQYDHDGDIQHGCSGSLINNRYVLTAAHCLTNKTDSQLFNVRLGEFDKSQYIDCDVHDAEDGVEKDCAEPAEDYGVESITIHPDYHQESFRNDIGLIRLNRDVTMHDNTSPICLPVTSSLRSSTIPKYIGTGWGTCANQTGANTLQSSDLTAVDTVECNRAVSNDQAGARVSETQTCATRFKGMDIGGALGAVMSHSHAGQKFVQFGIASGAVDSCAREGVPGVYTRVASYMEWILDTINP